MENKDIQVKHSGVVALQVFPDPPDGDLFIAEAEKNIPFAVKRVYFINNLANAQAVRGKHAHKELEQVIFCINGSFALDLDDGDVKQRIHMNDSSHGIILGPELWHTMTEFSRDCVILVLASDFFNADDYIRNYDEFLRYIDKKQ